MGMYTEIHFMVRIRLDLPEEFYEWIRHWLRKDLPDLEWKMWEKPYENHPFFDTPRWEVLPHMNSSYFQFNSHSVFQEDAYRKCLCIHANLKNYDGEIEKFLDWIKPYCEYGDFDEPVGYYRYESTIEPTIIVLSEL